MRAPRRSTAINGRSIPSMMAHRAISDGYGRSRSASDGGGTTMLPVLSNA
jgi:hypothetical protein